MKKLLVALTLLTAALASHASVTVNATLVGADHLPAKFAYLRFDLKYCGLNIPQVPSDPATMVLKSIKLTQAQLPATIVANDEIFCGNTPSTLWHVTAFSDSNTPIAGDFDYELLAGTAWNLASAQPFVGTPPPPGFKPIFANPTQTQTLTQPTGTSFKAVGIFDFTAATVLGITGGSSSGGTTVKVNTVTVDTPNFGTSPAAPSGSINVNFAASGSNVSASVPLGTTSGTAAAGNDSRLTGAEQVTNKDANNGYAGLDSGGKLKTTEFPSTITSGTTGNAATATAFATTPGQCASGQLSTGITATGTANCNPRLSDDTSALSYSASGGLVGVKFTSTAGGSSIQGLTAPCASSAGPTDPCFTVTNTSAATIFVSNNDATVQIGTGSTAVVTLTAIQTSGTVATAGIVRMTAAGTMCWTFSGSNRCLSIDGSGALLYNGSAVGSGGGGGGGGFDSITTGVNTTADMTVGSGARILLTGTGIVTANRTPVAGIQLPGATSGQATIVASSVAGTPTINIGTQSGIIVVGGNTPLSVNAATGIMNCVSCTTAAVTLTSGQLLRGNGAAGIAVTDLSGDATTVGSAVTVVGKVNAVVYPAGPPVSSVPIVTASNTVAYRLIPNCVLSTCALQFNTSTNQFQTTNISGTLSGLTPNRILKALSGSSAGDSLLSDDATTLNYTGTGGVTASKFTSNTSTNAGFVAFIQGPTNVAPANSVLLQAPTIVPTAYILTLPTAGPAASGLVMTDASGNLSFSTIAGNTSKFATVSGSLTSGNLVKSDASGNLVDAGLALASISGNTTKVVTLTGTTATNRVANFDASGNLKDAGFALTALQGNTTTIKSVSGSFVVGNAVTVDANGNFVDSGATPGGGGGSGAVTSGTAGQMTVYAATGTTVSGSSNFTFVAGALTIGQAGSVQGSLVLSGSTSNTVTLTTSAAAGGGTVTLQTGTYTLTGRNTTDTLTNKTINSESTGNVITTLSSGTFDAASCSNSVPGVGALDFDGAYTTNCLIGTNNIQGTWDMPDSGSTKGTIKFQLPSTWTGNIDLNLWGVVTSLGGSNAVKLTVETSCVAATESYDAAWNAAQTITQNVGANNITTLWQQLAVTSTGCAAGETLRMRIGRDTTDTFTGIFRLINGSVTLRHT